VALLADASATHLSLSRCRLHQLSTETNAAVTAAEGAFRELYALNSSSIAVIRLYAAFNLHVLSNTEKATVLTTEADRLEDLKSKDHSAEGAGRLNILAESTLDIFSDSTAIVQLSASPRDVGSIVSLNASACKLFGYSRVQLERRSAFSLIPPPIGDMHERALQHYLATGEGSIVGFVRVMFALTKSGGVQVVLSTIRDAPVDDGPPMFLWMLRELRTELQHVIIDDNDHITAASQSFFTITGLTPEALDGLQVTIGDFIAEWGFPEVQEQLRSPQGMTLLIDAPMAGDIADDVEPGDDGSVTSSLKQRHHHELADVNAPSLTQIASVVISRPGTTPIDSSFLPRAYAPRSTVPRMH